MLIDLLCQSYPPHCVVLRLEISEWLWKKSHREQPIVRLAMCERSSLGLPHTQNCMSRSPQVAEILLMRSPQTPRVCGDLKTRPKFVGLVGQFGGKFYCPKLRRRTVTTQSSLPSPGDAIEARNRPGLPAHGGGWARGAAARCGACAREHMDTTCSRGGGSRRWRPFAPVRTPQCYGGAGQKEVSCAGQRAPARAARVVR